MTTLREIHLAGLSGLLAAMLAGPAHAQIGGAGGAPNISGAGTGLSSPNVSPGVTPLTGNAAGAPGIVAQPAPAIPTYGYGVPGMPGGAGTQPVTGVPNAAPPIPVTPRPRPH